MEDGREIFDDDLDDDVVEKRGENSWRDRQFWLKCQICRNTLGFFFPFFVGKGGAKGAESKKTAKKAAVTKPNTIKSLFMNSNVKKPAEVRILFLWNANNVTFFM